jgi:hypothetical protein
MHGIAMQWKLSSAAVGELFGIDCWAASEWVVWGYGDWASVSGCESEVEAREIRGIGHIGQLRLVLVTVWPRFNSTETLLRAA